ncbi:hypothetical protein H6P81_003396 [Aristolochia fimbriata]|uniref:Serine acetyltransferase n=1 Tax=Aristolochia fimbriata TaxID=158543 RepID=A0AAV7FCM8_ARIFI|nr:hypothetical protein H6P81_003396 [Aristolochia fimbriata]
MHPQMLVDTLNLCQCCDLYHAVTLGGTEKEVGDHHPKIGQGALIGVAANILGNIIIGEGAMVATRSLVLKDMPPQSMAVGIPAKVVGYVKEQDPSVTMKRDATKDFCKFVALKSVEERSDGAENGNFTSTSDIFGFL